MIFNGLAKKSNFTEKDVLYPKELQMGIKTEMEHTDDLNTAKHIALDHLSEDQNYYSKLNKMEGNDSMNLKDIMAKGKKIGDGPYKDSKLMLLKELQKAMSGDMAEDVKGLKKVTVASPDQEGLEMGLDKAKEMLESKQEPEVEDEKSEEDESEDKDEESGKMGLREKIEDLEKQILELKSMLSE